LIVLSVREDESLVTSLRISIPSGYARFNVSRANNASAIIGTDQMCVTPLNGPRRIRIVLENM